MVERIIEQGPELKPGERFPLTFNERIGQMGRFGPASMAYYLGWISMVLAIIAGLIETYLAWGFGRSTFDKLIFASATLALSAAITVLPTPLYYFSSSKAHESEGWIGRLFLFILVIISLIATALFVANSFDPRLVPDVNDIFGRRNVSHGTPPRETRGLGYIVPYENAIYNEKKARERFDYVKGWCEHWPIGNKQACADLDGAERKFKLAQRELRESKAARFGADAPEADQIMSPRDYAHLVFAVLVLWLLQVSRLILPYIASEGGKTVMLERFDRPVTVAAPAEPMYGEEEEEEPIDTFKEWREERLVQDTAIKGTKFADMFQDYQRFCWRNPAYRTHAVNKAVFANSLGDYIDSLKGLAARHRSDGSKYDGIGLSS